MNTRSITIQIPEGTFVEKQSNGAIRVNVNLDNCTADTIQWLFEKGLTLSIRNAYASKKTTEARQIEAQRKADEIAENFRKAGSSSQWSILESVMIRSYVSVHYNGTMPKGGMHKVWNEIVELPAEKFAKLQQAAEINIELAM